MTNSTEETPPSIQKVRTPAGLFDILPDQQLYYTYIKKVVRHRCRQSGFRRITTPMFEFNDITTRAIGAGTDLVEQELYPFSNRKGNEMVLKPDGTVGVARAYVEHGLHELPQPVELYYIEPHFRQGPTGKGSYHQFWQFGMEVIGELDAALDAQVVQLAHKILEDLGIAHLFSIQVNTVGCPACREKYFVDLENYYIGKERSMCGSCVDRLHKNPLRLLDCKEEDCQILAKLAPKLKDYLCKPCGEFHEKFLEYLDGMGVRYEENPGLVRGFDYYTRSVFEFWDPKFGPDQAVGGGGRYDNLIESMGGEPTPAAGVAFGMERLIFHMKREKIEVPSKDNLHVFVAQLGDAAKKKCLNLIWDLRDRGIKVVGALGKGSVRDQLKVATQFQVPYTLILGITEVRENTIIIRNMAKGQQRTVSFDAVVDEVVQLIGEDHLDTYSPGEIIYS